MATIRKRTNGLLELRYIDVNNERRSLYLPKNTTKLVAQTICTKVDHIVTRQKTGSEPDRPVAEWLAGLGDNFYNKLVKAGLAPARTPAEAEPAKQVPTLKQWTDRYISKHTAKPGTMNNLRHAAQHLMQFFGEDRQINTITPGDAEDYRKWLQKHGNQRLANKNGLAEATLRRYIGRSKQFFRSALKHQLIDHNPFADEPSSVKGNAERLFLVPAEWVERCIRVAPCEDWRIILAFARYAGMRSHECRIQRWEDIDLVNNRMTIRSNKTPAIRTCPIFPELRPHLLRAREMAPAGAVYVQHRYRADDNIGTTFNRIVVKAGLVPWQKPLQNMRATRETELMAHYPVKDVSGWLGNSPAVVFKHYAMPMQASFDKAVQHGAKLPGLTAETEPKKVPPKVPHNIPQTASDNPSHTRTQKPVTMKTTENGPVCLLSSLPVLLSQHPGQDSNLRPTD
jgi:integrase